MLTFKTTPNQDLGSQQLNVNPTCSQPNFICSSIVLCLQLIQGIKTIYDHVTAYSRFNKILNNS